MNLEKSELEAKQVFDFVGYQFDLKSGRVRPTNTGPLADPAAKNTGTSLLTSLSGPAVMSLIGLLTATGKQVHLG